MVKEIETAGYRITYKDRFRFLSNFLTKGYEKALVTKSLFFYRKEEDLSNVSIFFSDSKKVVKSSRAAKAIWIDYSLRLAQRGELPMLFSKSPNLLLYSDYVFSKSKDLTDTICPIKILMAGDIDAKRYNNPDMKNKFDMMSR